MSNKPSYRQLCDLAYYNVPSGISPCVDVLLELYNQFKNCYDYYHSLSTVQQDDFREMYNGYMIRSYKVSAMKGKNYDVETYMKSQKLIKKTSHRLLKLIVNKYYQPFVNYLLLDNIHNNIDTPRCYSGYSNRYYNPRNNDDLGDVSPEKKEDDEISMADDETSLLNYRNWYSVNYYKLKENFISEKPYLSGKRLTKSLRKHISKQWQEYKELNQ